MTKTDDLGQDEARTAIDACIAEFRKRGKTGVIAVADSHGELISLVRLDGAPLPSIEIAANKAYTSARTRSPSGDVGRGAAAEAADVHYHGSLRYVGWDGGVPVFVKDRCVGAVAVSGLTGAEDLEIAQVGVAAILAAHH